MEFNIGERVVVRQYEDLPEEIKNKGLGKNAGKAGEVVDVMYSNARDCYLYKIRFDGCDVPSRTDFPSGALYILTEEAQPEYKYEFEFLENLVTARLYEVTEDSKTEIARGHGHIIHEGVLGIAQAASYAVKRIYMKISEG